MQIRKLCKSFRIWTFEKNSRSRLLPPSQSCDRPAKNCKNILYSNVNIHGCSLINIIWQTLDLQILVRKSWQNSLFIAALWDKSSTEANYISTKSWAWLNSVFTVQFIFYLKYLYFASIIRLSPLEKLTNISSQSQS